MKKILSFSFLLNLCGVVQSQIYTPASPSIYGQSFNRLKPVQVLHIPQSSDTLLRTNDTSSQIRVINGKLMYHLGYWRNVGGGGGGGSLVVDSTPTNVHIDTLGSKLVIKNGLPVINPVDYGAKGDGVVDNYAVVQSLINAGKALSFPVGVYKFSQPLTNTGNISITGSGTPPVAGNNPEVGNSGVIFKWAGSDTANIITIDPNLGTSASISGVKFYVNKTFTGKVIRIKGGRVTNEQARSIVDIHDVGFYRTPLDYTASYAPTNSSSIAVYYDLNDTSATFACDGYQLHNAYFFNFGTGIKVDVANNPNHFNFFNSNYIRDVYMYQVARALDLKAGTVNSEITANTFSSIHVQPGLSDVGTAATGVLRFDGNVYGNSFYGIKVWDVPDDKKLAVLNATNSDANGLYVNTFYGANIPPTTACLIYDDIRPTEFIPQYKTWYIPGTGSLKFSANGLQLNADKYAFDKDIIRNTTTQQVGANINIDGNAIIGNSATSRIFHANSDGTTGGYYSSINTANPEGFDFGLLGGASDPNSYVINRHAGAALLIKNSSNQTTATFNDDKKVNFTSTVSGANAAMSGDFVTLQQLNDATTAASLSKVLRDSNYTIIATDGYLVLPEPTATRTITLPAASTMQNKVLVIDCKSTTTGRWILNGSIVQASTTGATFTENFTNSGLTTGKLTINSTNNNGTWQWFAN